MSKHLLKLCALVLLLSHSVVSRCQPEERQEAFYHIDLHLDSSALETCSDKDLQRLNLFFTSALSIHSARSSDVDFLFVRTNLCPEEEPQRQLRRKNKRALQMTTYNFNGGGKVRFCRNEDPSDRRLAGSFCYPENMDSNGEKCVLCGSTKLYYTLIDYGCDICNSGVGKGTKTYYGCKDVNYEMCNDSDIAVAVRVSGKCFGNYQAACDLGVAMREEDRARCAQLTGQQTIATTTTTSTTTTTTSTTTTSTTTSQPPPTTTATTTVQHLTTTEVPPVSPAETDFFGQNIENLNSALSSYLTAQLIGNMETFKKITCLRESRVEVTLTEASKEDATSVCNED